MSEFTLKPRRLDPEKQWLQSFCRMGVQDPRSGWRSSRGLVLNWAACSAAACNGWFFRRTFGVNRIIRGRKPLQTTSWCCFWLVHQTGCYFLCSNIITRPRKKEQMCMMLRVKNKLRPSDIELSSQK